MPQAFLDKKYKGTREEEQIVPDGDKKDSHSAAGASGRIQNMEIVFARAFQAGSRPVSAL
jgi:hypothetical protein